MKAKTMIRIPHQPQSVISAKAGTRGSKPFMQPIAARASSRGFVLISSLIFLVVVTLLAVTAMNSSTVQETMASNLREKSRARQSADAALRQGELLLENAAFDTYQAPGSVVALKNEDNLLAGNTPATVKLWYSRGMLGDDDDDQDDEDDDTVAFLNKTLWADGGAMEYAFDSADDGTAPVQYYVEDHDFIPRDLNPDTAAVADGGVIYRVTARAEGENLAAVAVTQSLYEKNY